MKVIVAGENEKVVGIHVIGMGADEMMQGFGVAMKVRITKCVVQSLTGVCFFLTYLNVAPPASVSRD